jgi:hypothetical protein
VDAPEESNAPGHFTARLRRFLLSDGEALFRAKALQAEHQRKEAEADVPSRSE